MGLKWCEKPLFFSVELYPHSPYNLSLKCKVDETPFWWQSIHLQRCAILQTLKKSRESFVANHCTNLTLIHHYTHQRQRISQDSHWPIFSETHIHHHTHKHTYSSALETHLKSFIQLSSVLSGWTRNLIHEQTAASSHWIH